MSGHDPPKDVRTFKANFGIASLILLYSSSDNVCHDVPRQKITFVSNGQILESSSPENKIFKLRRFEKEKI